MGSLYLKKNLHEESYKQTKRTKEQEILKKYISDYWKPLSKQPREDISQNKILPVQQAFIYTELFFKGSLIWKTHLYAQKQDFSAICILWKLMPLHASEHSRYAIRHDARF